MRQNTGSFLSDHSDDDKVVWKQMRQDLAMAGSKELMLRGIRCCFSTDLWTRSWRLVRHGKTTEVSPDRQTLLLQPQNSPFQCRFRVARPRCVIVSPMASAVAGATSIADDLDTDLGLIHKEWSNRD